MVISDKQPDSRLTHLMEAERRAQERYERLGGYPDDVRQAALALWKEVTEAVRLHNERWRSGRD